MKKIFTLPTWVVAIFLISPIFFVPSILGLALLIIWETLLTVCIYSLGNNLYKKLPPNHNLKLERFHIFLFFILVYTLACMIIFKGGYDINQDTYQDYGWGVYVLVPLHIFLIYCMFYILRFLAKAIATIEYNGNVLFGEYVGYIFLFFFFPIGIWIMHPKIRKILTSTENRTEDAG